MLESAIRKLLIDSAPVAAMLGDATSRVFAERAPQGLSPPYVIYQPIAWIDQAESFDGQDALTWDRVQVDCYAATAAAAIDLARAVNAALANHRGVVTVDAATSPPTVVNIWNVRRINRAAIPEEPGQPNVFRRLQEFSIAWDDL
jgi:hypothetical protein